MPPVDAQSAEPTATDGERSEWHMIAPIILPGPVAPLPSARRLRKLSPELLECGAQRLAGNLHQAVEGVIQLEYQK